MMRQMWLVPAMFLVLGAAAPKSAHAQFSFKLGSQFSAGDAGLDSSKQNWIVGQSTDMWFSEHVGLSYETNFSYDRYKTDTQSRTVLSIYNYVNLKLRVPKDGITPYFGGGIGYSPVFLETDGKRHNIGGLSAQALAGLNLADHFYIEAQYKMTDIEDRDSQRLFTVFGGFSF